MEEIMANINKKTIILGDFNSLKRSDYNDAEWKIITEEDKSKNITTKHDLIDLVELYNFTDCFEKINEPAPKVSAWNMRRMDYIFVGEHFDHKITRANILYTNASKHCPIYMDIV